jgi:hypothetical protein
MDLPDSGGSPLERLTLPDVRRLGRTPSWPEWVVSLSTLMRDAEQRSTKDGKYRNIPTLPVDAIPSPEQRAILERYVADVEQMCGQTPEADVKYEKKTFAILIEFMLLFPTLRQQGEAGVEAQGKAYMFVLKEVPYWAVLRAVELWQLGEAGHDDRGEPYNYRWPPAPADLRRIAKAQVLTVNSLSAVPRRLLAAEARIEFSDEHCAKMRALLLSLKLEIG